MIDTAGLMWIWPLLTAPFIGSFIGVLIVRLPARRPVAIARSTCAHCGASLGVTDLVPLVSFLLLRGRCRHCGAPIGRFHPAAELAAVAVVVWVMLADVQPDRVWLSCALGWTLLTLAWIDWMHFLLPDVLTLPLLLTGLAVTLARQPNDLADHCIAAILVYLAFAALSAAYRKIRGRDGLGGGDSKLIAAAGAWCGLAALPLLVFGSAIFGLLAALALALTGRTMTSTTRIPFGPCIALAFWLVWLHGTLADSLLELLGRQ